MDTNYSFNCLHANANWIQTSQKLSSKKCLHLHNHRWVLSSSEAHWGRWQIIKIIIIIHCRFVFKRQRSMKRVFPLFKKTENLSVLDDLLRYHAAKSLYQKLFSFCSLHYQDWKAFHAGKCFSCITKKIFPC